MWEQESQTAKDINVLKEYLERKETEVVQIAKTGAMAYSDKRIENRYISFPCCRE